MRRFSVDNHGAETVEYALVIGLVAIAAVSAIGLAGGNIATFWSNLASAINSVNPYS